MLEEQFNLTQRELRRVLDEIRYISPRLTEGDNVFTVDDDVNTDLLCDIMKGIYPAVTRTLVSKVPRFSPIRGYPSPLVTKLEVRVDYGQFKHTFETYYGARNK